VVQGPAGGFPFNRRKAWDQESPAGKGCRSASGSVFGYLARAEPMGEGGSGSSFLNRVALKELFMVAAGFSLRLHRRDAGATRLIAAFS
jgi:hypothetical protein